MISSNKENRVFGSESGRRILKVEQIALAARSDALLLLQRRTRIANQLVPLCLRISRQLFSL